MQDEETEGTLAPAPGWEDEAGETAPGAAEDLPTMSPPEEAPPAGTSPKRAKKPLQLLRDRAKASAGASRTTERVVSSREFSEGAQALIAGAFDTVAFVLNRRFGRVDEEGRRDDLWAPLPQEREQVAQAGAKIAAARLPEQVTSAKGGELVQLVVVIAGYAIRNLMGTSASQVLAVQAQMAAQGGPGGAERG